MIRAYQYQFDLELAGLQLQIPFPCLVELWWRKGNKKIITKKRLELTGRQKYFTINERLSMIATCHLEHSVFSQKPSIINIVVIAANNPNKSGGYYSLELTDVLKGHDPINPSSKTYDVNIQNCPTSHGRLQFSLSAKCLQQTQHNNQSFADQKHALLASPNRNNSADRNFRTGERDGYSPNSTSELQFSFKNKIPHQAIVPVASQTSKNVDNENFYQLLEIKRKLDERNMEYAKLQKDYALQMEKLTCIENENKHRQVKLFNQINTLTDEATKLKKQITEHTAIAAEQSINAAKATEELRRADNVSQRLQQLKNEVSRKQAEMISIENTMSKQLKEALADKERLNETLNVLSTEIRSQYDKIKDLQNQKLQLENSCIREKEANELKIRLMENNTKEKDAIIDVVRKDFERFSCERNELMKKFKMMEDSNRQLSTRLASTQKELELAKYVDNKKLSSQEIGIKEIQPEMNKLKAEYDYVVEEMLNRIKTLQETIQSKSNAIMQKQTLIIKAKSSVSQKEQEIKKRDQLISKIQKCLKEKQSDLFNAKSIFGKQKQMIDSLKSTIQQKDKQIKLLDGKLINLTEQISSHLNNCTAGKQLKGKKANQSEFLLQEHEQQVQRLKKQLQERSNSQMKGDQQRSQLLLQIEDLKKKVKTKDAQTAFLKRELQQIELEYQLAINQIKSSMKQTMKQNAQYKIQISIYAREIKNMQELLEKTQDKLLRFEAHEKSLTDHTHLPKQHQLHTWNSFSSEFSLDKSKCIQFVSEEISCASNQAIVSAYNSNRSATDII